MFLSVSNVLFPFVQCYKAPPLNQCSRAKVQHVNIHLLFIEIAKSQQCSISCEFNFAFIKLTGIFDSLYKPCSSACIGGTFADRGNSMLSHVFVFSDSWIKVTVHFFSAPLTFAAPYSFCPGLKMKMPRRVLGTVTSQWCVTVVIWTVFFFSLSPCRCTPCGTNSSCFHFQLHAISNVCWRSILKEPCGGFSACCAVHKHALLLIIC